MTSNEFESRRGIFSKAIDQLVERNTIIPSSETEDEGSHINNLRPFGRNSDNGTIPTSTPQTYRESLGPSPEKILPKTENAHTIEPHKTQLSSTSTSAVSFARKTILIRPQIPVKGDSDVDSAGSLFETDNALTPAVINVPPCDKCIEGKRLCKRKPRGRACVLCGLKRTKCSLVAEPLPKPVAHRTSDRPSDDSDDYSTEGIEYSLYDDTGDETFELDSEKVTLQRILGHLLRLNRKQEEHFGKLEAHLQEIQEELETVREHLGRVATEEV